MFGKNGIHDAAARCQFGLGIITGAPTVAMIRFIAAALVQPSGVGLWCQLTKTPFVGHI